MSNEKKIRRKVVGVSVPIKMYKCYTTALLECGHTAFYLAVKPPETLVCKSCARCARLADDVRDFDDQDPMLDMFGDYHP